MQDETNDADAASDDQRNPQAIGAAEDPPATLKAASAGAIFGPLRPQIRIPLTGSRLDRAAHLRDDGPARAAALSGPDVRAVPLWQGKPLIALGEGGRPPRLALPSMGEVAGFDDPSERPFLGLEDGAARVAIDLTSLDEAQATRFAEDLGSKFIDLRSIGPELDAGSSALIAEAKSLTDWSRRHRACAVCGAATLQAQGGWRRDCASCGAKHFPRTDPVVIMLALHRSATGRERVLIGRQRGWPPGMHSLLAGYVEPGESLEEAARREIWEEASVAVGHVSYIASQPWPFPSTLMVGMVAEVLSEDIAPDEEELEAVRWVDRDDMRAALGGAHPEISAPRPDAIARSLVAAWAEERLKIPF